jgi:hypothetical protein
VGLRYLLEGKPKTVILADQATMILVDLNQPLLADHIPHLLEQWWLLLV